MRRTLKVCLVMCVIGGVASSVPMFGASAQEERGAVSQGSIADHPYVDVTDGPSPGYSQLVDNDMKGRFDAPGWEKRSGIGQYGESYAYAGATTDEPARFQVKIPATGTYSIYARWPANESNSASASYGVKTSSGDVEWTEVDQRKDGDLWVKIGTFEMKEADSYAVQVAQDTAGSGEVVADAVVVLSGEQANPDEVTGEDTTLRAGKRPTGRDVVHKARTHLGTPYVRSPPHKCKSYHKEDCSCHTKVVFRRFGRSLPDNPPSQWKRGKRVKRSNLRPGDLVFFDENKNDKLQPWDHVGIYSGHGYLIHASSYFGEVVESKMKHIDGYWGAKRITKLRR